MLKSELNRFRSDIRKLSCENENLNTKITSLNEEIKSLKQEKITLFRKCDSLRLTIDLNRQHWDQVNAYLENREHDLKELLFSKEHAFSYMSVIFADYLLIDYENSIKYLETKKKPAWTEASRIKELKAKTKEYLIELNKIKYTLNDLLLTFPELEYYLDSNSYQTGKDTSETKPVSDELWNQLSSSQRSQLILDNYIRRKKTKWEIGRDYELYVGYKYSQQGYSVEYFGSNNKLADLGRDLIVYKNGEVGIVQCKYWSEKKTIHEKHIAQLYGTVVSYIIENNYLPSLVHGIFITNITLSDTARKFANYLDIKYKENYPIGDFPRIKCNINRISDGLESKIYHLPTDLQYDNVKIENEGECFVFTAEEAENLGFRHAYKWHNT